MKRTASEAGLDDPNKFLDEYWKENDMVDEADCELSRKILARAMEAKEKFKRIRMPPTSTDANASGEEKYNRRLANNRNSAAASRVHKEVLKRLQEYGLMEASQRAESLAAKVASLEARGANPRLEKKYEAMVEKVEKLEDKKDEFEELARRHLAKLNVLEDRMSEKEEQLKAMSAKNDELMQALKAKESELLVLRAKCMAQEKLTKEARVVKVPDSARPGSPIGSDTSMLCNAMSNVVPSLFQASQPDKDVVRYGLPRPPNTQSQSQESEADTVLKRDNVSVSSMVNSATPPSDLRLSIESQPVSIIESPPSSLHLGITQESQSQSQSQET